MNNTTLATTLTMDNSTMSNRTVMYKEIQIAFLMSIITTGLSVNTMLIVLGVLRRRYMFLSNMAISNYIAITMLSLKVVNLVLGVQQENDGVQQPNDGVQQPNVLLLALTELWWTTQNYTLVVISYQRYKLIREPFHASRYITKCYKSLAIAGMWAVSVILVLILEGGRLISYKYDPKIRRYRKNWEDNPLYTIFYFFICFLLPGLMLNYFQGYMFYKGRKSKRREHRAFRERTTSFSSSMRRHSHQSESTYYNGSRRLGSLSTHPSTDLSGILSTRKGKLSHSKLKPLFSTLLIVVPYIIAVVPEVVLMFMYYQTTQLSQDVDIWMGNTKYLIIPYFPIILCVTDSEVRYNIRKVVNKLKCCRSARVGNIDSRDYPENVSRRDSRRNSIISQQSNNNNNNNFHISTEEHSVTPPGVKQEIRYKNSSMNSSPTNSDTMTNLFFITNSSPINFPDVQT